MRQKIANDAGLPPYVICHDRTLVELAQKRPRTETALHDITGLGDRKIARYGAALLEVVHAHAIEPQTLPQPQGNGDNRLSVTVNQTLALHKSGKTAAEIASTRGFEIGTIYTHFAEAIEAGLVEANAVLSLDPSELDEINAAFEKCHTLDTGKLGPAHSALDGKYDYGLLKCVLAELG